MWGRVFTLLYDPFVARAERAGLGAARGELLRQANGRVLEVGAGTGLNIPHYPREAEVVYTEPDRHMAKRLRAKGVEVVEAAAETLPFPDASFDVVVSTLVFCTVPDLQAALRDVRRVLRSGGNLLFLEHVRAAPGSKLERWQRRLRGPWKTFACGCHCDRDFLHALAAESFVIEDVREENWRFMPPVVRPVVIGTASS